MPPRKIGPAAPRKPHGKQQPAATHASPAPGRPDARQRRTEPRTIGAIERRPNSTPYVAGIDYQCRNCGRIYRGPDIDWIPGKVVQEGKHGEKVVQGTMCINCARNRR